MLFLWAGMINNEADKLRLENIFQSYGKQMLYVANQVMRNLADAEDAVQEAFIGMAKTMDTVPQGDSEKLRAYVLVAAKHAALSLLAQRKKREQPVPFLEPSTGEEELFQQVAQSLDYELLLKVLRRLPPPYHEVLFLVCVEELRAVDAAVLLHRSEATVRQQLRRGKQMVIALCREEGLYFEQQHDDNLPESSVELYPRGICGYSPK